MAWSLSVIISGKYLKTIQACDTGYTSSALEP